MNKRLNKRFPATLVFVLPLIVYLSNCSDIGNVIHPDKYDNLPALFSLECFSILDTASVNLQNHIKKPRLALFWVSTLIQLGFWYSNLPEYRNYDVFTNEGEMMALVTETPSEMNFPLTISASIRELPLDMQTMSIYTNMFPNWDSLRAEHPGLNDSALSEKVRGAYPLRKISEIGLASILLFNDINGNGEIRDEIQKGGEYVYLGGAENHMVLYIPDTAALCWIENELNPEFIKKGKDYLQWKGMRGGLNLVKTIPFPENIFNNANGVQRVDENMEKVVLKLAEHPETNLDFMNLLYFHY